MAMPDDAKTWSMIHAGRASLADTIEGLTPDQWQTPSLCAGWSVGNMAAHLLSSVGDVNVGGELAAVRAPTLVLHSRGDMVVPMTDGIELASGVPRARFVPLDSKNHVPHAEEPAWQQMTGEVATFLAEIGACAR